MVNDNANQARQNDNADQNDNACQQAAPGGGDNEGQHRIYMVMITTSSDQGKLTSVFSEASERSRSTPPVE